MKLSVEALQAACRDVDPRLAAAHVDRLGPEYFRAFDRPSICRHLRALSGLSSREPVQLLFNTPSEGRVECTVIAFDYPAEFSLITGVLAGTGFNILSGRIFTYKSARASFAPVRRGRGRMGETPVDTLLRRRCIIDFFSGVLDGRRPMPQWQAAVAARLGQVLRLLESGRGEGLSDARHIVNDLVASQLSVAKPDTRLMLYPVDMKISRARGPYTVLHVVSQDTPAFLYSLSNALSLQGVSIERVKIETLHGRVKDEIAILDDHGQKIEDEPRLKQIRLCVLLTKQFTCFLPRAPDPYAALSRFESLVEDVVRLPRSGQWIDLLSDPKALRDLARILGTSDFLWEDFVRTQYEALQPLLGAGEQRRLSFTHEALAHRLGLALAGRRSGDEEPRLLNEWKDREIFLIDLDHILHAGADVRALAEPLTTLAEIVVDRAVGAVYRLLVRRFGEPRTVGGLAARWAAFGLGKFGGVALGYASDIELLFVFSDNGETDGPEPLSNAEFFDRLAGETARFIEAKREGIFHVDLRLRPYGSSGPRACSLETFCRYYGSAGESLSYERLSLTRLRWVCGDRDFGLQVERLRDGFVYEGAPLDVAELRRLRERQFEEKARSERYNAKFSPGALVDLEYYVQILQVMHGREHLSLRTPRIHKALSALSEAGILDPTESQQLTNAYYFLRHLINGLRMLRGNALDLFLPEPGSDEHAHLARRMGYEVARGLDPAKQLLVDFETHTARIRAFIERHFGRETLSDPTRGNVVDLVLSAEPSPEMARRILGRAGFVNVERALLNLRRLAGQGARREAFIPIAVLAADWLRSRPDPDMALNNWERFVGALPDAVAHYALLLSQPRRIEILLGILAGSQFLSDSLTRYPEFLDWVTNPEILQGTRRRATLQRALAAFAGEGKTHEAWLDLLRKFRKRETLRIGTRDICLQAPLAEVTADLSALADALTEAALDREWKRLAAEFPREVRRGLPEAFCILGLGKLGGAELNYSSDIDLIGVYDEAALGRGIEESAAHQVFERVMERTRAALSSHGAEGYVYRVDLRLRPHGTAGHLVDSIGVVRRYYEERAALWEVQALLKLRPVAGSPKVGARLLRKLRPVMLRRRDAQQTTDSILRMREKTVQSGRAHEQDVKTGLGGIRDIEFLVQGLQLQLVATHPKLWTGNTLQALAMLHEVGALAEADAGQLRDDYVFLRQVEHYLQILEDQQIHALPSQPAQLAALARRVLGPERRTQDFLDRLAEVQHRTRATYLRILSARP